MDYINDYQKIQNKLITMEMFTPQYIVDYLDKYIIGQTDAKKAVAVALRNRYRRMKLTSEIRDSITPKNLMMIGPTGVGKTEIARKIAKLIGAPFIKVEATKYTEVGYVGRDVESMVRDLVANGISIVKKEEAHTNKGKILLAANEHIFKEVSKNKVSMGLGDMDDARIRTMINNGELDNKELDVKVNASTPNPLGDMMQGINVVGMDSGFPPDLSKLFGGGKKITKKVTIGKARELFKNEEMEKIADDDFIVEEAKWRVEQLGIVFIDEFDKIASSQQEYKGGGNISREGVQRDILPIVEGSQVHTRYGMIDTENILFIAAGAFYVAKPSDLIPELQGRFPIRVELQELSVEDFVKILSETENSLVDQYIKLLSTEQVKVTVDTHAIESIADIAYTMNSEAENIGARRLYTVMEKIFEELMFVASQMPNSSVHIDENYISERIKNMTGDIDSYKYIL